MIVDELTYGAGFPWPLTGSGSSLELIHPSLDNAIPGHWRSSAGNPTPKAQNSVFAINAPPALSQVSHAPLAPTSADDVTIIAHAADPDGVASVTLHVQLVEPGSYIRFSDPAYASSWTSLPMTDNGGGVWTAILDSATYQTHRRLVRYRISAVDGLGAAVTAPYPDDTQPNFAYFVYDGLPHWSGAAKPGDAGPLGTVINYDFETMQNVPGITVTEEDVNSTAYVQVSLSAATGQGITTTLSFTTIPGTAVPHEDYLSTAGTLVITQTPTVQLPLTIVGDTRYELTESLTMQFSGNAGLLANGVAITILDNDPQPSLSVADVVVDEGAGSAVFTVTLSAASGVTATVDYETVPGTATAGEDYQPVSGTLTFAPSQTVQTIASPSWTMIPLSNRPPRPRFICHWWYGR